MTPPNGERVAAECASGVIMGAGVTSSGEGSASGAGVGASRRVAGECANDAINQRGRGGGCRTDRIGNDAGIGGVLP